MQLTERTLSSGRQEDIPGNSSNFPLVIGPEVLRRMMSDRIRGTSGPAREDAPEAITERDILLQLPDEVREWSGVSTVVAEVAARVNKLIDRSNRSGHALLSLGDVAPDLAQTISGLAEAFEFRDTQQARTAVTRLALSYSPEEAAYYASEDFVYDLQDIAEGQPALQHEIGDFYTLNEVIRRACYTLQPIRDSRESVEKAATILRDRTSYLETVTGSPVDRTFVSALTPNTVLTVTNRALRSVDEVFVHGVQMYEKYREQYPLFAAQDSQHMVNILLKAGVGADHKLLEDRFEHIEKLLDRAAREHPHEAQLRAFITRSGNKQLSYDNVIARFYRTKATRFIYDEPRRGETPASRQARVLLETPYLQVDDYSALEHGVSYKNTLYEIVTSPRFTDAEKTALFEKIRTIRAQARQFAEHLRPAFADRSDAIYRGIDRRITEIMYTAKYYSEHGDESIEVPMGSRRVDVSVTPQEILRSLSFIESAMRNLARIEVTPGDDNIDSFNIETGYVQGTEDTVLMVSKAEYDDERMPLLRGRSPRINFVSGMGGIVPSTIATEREQGCLSIRIDLDGDEIVVDLGGKTDNPYTPDFTVARCVSLGAWLRGRELGADNQDYHVTVGQVAPDEFAEIVRNSRRMIKLSPTALRIPHAPA